MEGAGTQSELGATGLRNPGPPQALAPGPSRVPSLSHLFPAWFCSPRQPAFLPPTGTGCVPPAMEVCAASPSPHPQSFLSESITSFPVLSPSLAGPPALCDVLSCYLVLKLQSGGRLIIHGQVSGSVWQVWRDEGCSPWRNLSPSLSPAPPPQGRGRASHPCPCTHLCIVPGVPHVASLDGTHTPPPCMGTRGSLSGRGPTIGF